MTDKILKKTYGEYNWKKNFFKHASGDLTHNTFTANAIAEDDKARRESAIERDARFRCQGERFDRRPAKWRDRGAIYDDERGVAGLHRVRPDRAGQQGRQSLRQFGKFDRRFTNGAGRDHVKRLRGLGVGGE